MAAIVPIMAQREGMISKYRGNLFAVSINNPKVKSVEVTPF